MDSPFQHLLPKALSLIFHYAAQYSVDNIPLSSVCSHWRACALAHAEWWADLRSSPDRVTSLALFELFLARSGDAPLAIDLDTGDSHCLSLLEPHAHRIRKLDFVPRDLALPAFLLPGSSMPLLELLAVHNADYDTDLIHTPSLQLSAPKLHTIILKGVVVHEWNSVDLPALRKFYYSPYIEDYPRSGYGVPVRRILTCLLSKCPQISHIHIKARSLQMEFGGAVVVPGTGSGHRLEVLKLWLCCSGCAMRTLRPFAYVLARLRILGVVATNLPRGAARIGHDETDSQRKKLVAMLLFGHTYRTLEILPDEDDYEEDEGEGEDESESESESEGEGDGEGEENKMEDQEHEWTPRHDERSFHVRLSNIDDSRNVILKVADPHAPLNWPLWYWRLLRLDQTLWKIVIPLELWDTFAALARKHTFMDSDTIRLFFVFADTWADLLPKRPVLQCGSVTQVNIRVRRSLEDPLSAFNMVFRMQPILNILNSMSFTAQSVQLVLAPSKYPDMDAMLEKRLLLALNKTGETQWTMPLWRV
ncbi:hypothetical protein EXIGLDRAFT_729276 [Exidia glandulosa HHB12029]|uniref:F-box domain-containing protein n=1 Tax=Exidia glandulosa HHB12029 TaxID=1314781 RepID=A0A165CNN2_EXIGL|nr:hypothetical protein EXIGLDRAFT_729276 [Exidia glandulosa HHB12029]